MLRWLKPLLALLVVAVTLVLFVRYFAQHPAYWQQLAHISPWTVVWVMLLNILMVALLVLICDATVRLCGHRISLRENFLLTAFSSLANFFGPLQSGPGVRGVYLKAKHQVHLRDYALASLLLLGCFAFFSALFLLAGSSPWWQTILVLLVVGLVSVVVIRLFMRRDKHPDESRFALRPGPLAALIVLAFLQVVVTIGWYYVELRAVNPHIGFRQAMSYAGAANFALFVSITPDAIGIREAFLLFSQHIHHVSSANIISANVIDRAVYVVFLGILFVVVLLLHARERLGIKGR